MPMPSYTTPVELPKCCKNASNLTWSDGDGADWEEYTCDVCGREIHVGIEIVRAWDNAERVVPAAHDGYAPRACNTCESGMWHGYCCDEGTYCSQKCLFVHGYTPFLFEQDLEADAIYWTTWVKEDGEEEYPVWNGQKESDNDAI